MDPFTFHSSHLIIKLHQHNKNSSRKALIHLCAFKNISETFRNPFKNPFEPIEMTRRGNNISLVSFGQQSRGRGRRHATPKDLLSDGIKYGAAFRIAREGFKAWGNQNNNQQQPMQQPVYQPVQQPMQRGQSASPPPYQTIQQGCQPQPRQLPDANGFVGHQSWCNGQCNGQCSLRDSGEVASYYHEDGF